MAGFPHPLLRPAATMTSIFQTSLLLALLLVPFSPLLAQNEADVYGQAEFDRIEKYFAYGNRVQDRHEKERYLAYSVRAYRKFLRAYPGHQTAAKASYHLGYALQALGQTAEASRQYQSVIDTHRNGHYVGAAARQLAYLAEASQNHQGAARYFQTAAQNLNDQQLRWSALAKEAHNLIRAKDRPAAIAALQVIIGEPGNPHHDWARFSLGYQHHLAKNTEKAIEILAPLT
ncbi:MAG: tetratricopeptide repeat protein, partial [Verrucomicrobiales bacterium]